MIALFHSPVAGPGCGGVTAGNEETRISELSLSTTGTTVEPFPVALPRLMLLLLLLLSSACRASKVELYVLNSV